MARSDGENDGSQRPPACHNAKISTKVDGAMGSASICHARGPLLMQTLGRTTEITTAEATPSVILEPPERRRSNTMKVGPHESKSQARIKLMITA
jgi:hypothetical protein